MRAVIGIDIGTSSSKGVLVGLDGTIVARADRQHEVSRPHPGHVEMDAATWWDDFVAIARDLVRAATTPTTGPAHAAPTGPATRVSIAAVGVSGMGPCTLLTDAAGTPVRPAILYGIDTRATEQIARLTAELGADAIIARCNAPLTSQAVGPKLAWVADHEPEAFARARRLFMPSSWLAWKLTGAYVLDHCSASQAWPLYDATANGWYEPWARRICPEIELPGLAWADDVVGTVSADAAAETGLPAGIPVIAGTIDAWAEAVSAGAHGAGDTMVMYGTTMAALATAAEPFSSSTHWPTVGALPGTYTLVCGMATSGAITAWLRELFGSPGYPELLGLAEASGPGARGLLMLPYFAGERTPLQDPDARGVIAGLTLSHTRGDLYRAALEATAFGLRHNIELMRESGARIERVVAVGGGTQGSLWTRIVSDVTGLSQVIPTQTTGASLGSAFLAARTVSDVDIDTWNPPATVCRPNPDLAAGYEEAYGAYRSLYPATREIAHRLAETQRRAGT